MKNVSYPVPRSTTLKPADLIRATNELQLEGVIAKRKSSIYQPGKRTSAWLKYKINQSQEFVVGCYTLGGNPFDALIVDCYDDGKLRYVGKVRAGFVPHIPCAMFPLLPQLMTDECPLRIYRRRGERFIRSLAIR